MNIPNLAGLTASLALLVAAVATAGVVYHPDLRVAMGDSMEPTIDGPAVVHCDTDIAPDTIKKGDIVVTQHTYLGSGEEDRDETTIMHRVTESRSDGYVRTRGDNNTNHDGLTPITDVECVYTTHVELPA